MITKTPQKPWACAVFLLIASATSSVFAVESNTTIDKLTPTSKTPSYYKCFYEAGEKFNIHPMVLWSIAVVESKMNPNSIGKNKNGTIDVGLMQINSVHFPKLESYGIKPEDLLDPCTNIDAGAWELSDCIRRFGLNENALTCYNGLVPKNLYASKVMAILEKKMRMVKTSD
jgi:soluble lytic murein transglycosylase-like protein